MNRGRAKIIPEKAQNYKKNSKYYIEKVNKINKL
jgi:ABC-type Zn uptake system ZnuABC Zn-binding protein ZnuA